MNKVISLVLLVFLSACGEQTGWVVEGAKGDKGDQGEPAEDYSDIRYVSLCEPPQGWSEIAILYQGEVLVSKSKKEHHRKTKFSVLKPGVYGEDDGYSCEFTITSDGPVIH